MLTVVLVVSCVALVATVASLLILRPTLKRVWSGLEELNGRMIRQEEERRNVAQAVQALRVPFEDRLRAEYEKRGILWKDRVKADG